MQIGDEVIWSAVSAIVVGLTLKSSEFFMNRRTQAQKDAQDKINSYHTSVEQDLDDLRAENRRLREEADKYRLLYHQEQDKKSI